MYKKIYQIWVDIAYFGVDWEMPDGLKKRIILSNLASITLAVILVIFNVFQTISFHKYYVTIVASLLILYLTSIPIINKAGYTTFTRVSMCIIMPISFLFIVPYEQIINPEQRDIAYHTVPRFSILAMLVLPVSLLDHKNWLRIGLGLGIIFTSLLFLEEVHDLFTVNENHSDELLKRLYLIKAISIAAFTFLALGFFFFKRVNQRFENRINRLLDKEKTTNADLQGANQELEASHRKISDLLEELKKTNNNLIESQAQLQETYEEIQTAELVTRERAVEIERQKEQIEKKNVAIVEKNQLLAEAQKKIEEANEELKATNSSLEEMVNERTARLRYANEELLQANQELDLFIYRASHDLRGPIASILGLTKIAKLEQLREAQMSYLGMLEQTANNANEILSKLLLVNIVNQAAEYNEVDFKTFIDHIKELYQYKFDKYKIDFRVEIEDGVKLTSDQSLLTIICERFIENAIDFRSHRHDEASLIKLSFFKQGEKFVMEIADNGIGIPKSFYQRIFGMFFRASEKSKGNGLGLYIARKATEKIRGEITFKSKIDVGSTFRLTLPVN